MKPEEGNRLQRFNKAQDKLAAAMTALRRTVPILSVQIMRRPVELVWDAKTLRTSGKKIEVGIDWILRTPLWEVVSGLAHEKFHDNLLHFLRIKGRDFDVFNEAADLVVNYNMVEAGMKIGEKWLFDPYLGKHSVEVVYDKLMTMRNKMNPNPPPGDGNGPPGDGNKPSPNDGPYKPISNPNKELIGEVVPMTGKDGEDPSPEEEQEAVVQERLSMQAGLKAAQRAGKVPMNIQRIITAMVKSQVHWAEAVDSWVDTVCPDDYSWKRPNRRYIQNGLYMPIMHDEVMGDLLVFCDTSGSISGKMLSDMCSDIHVFLSTHKLKSMTVLYIDVAVQGVQTFEYDEEPKFNPRGGGGTSFRPGFEWLENELDKGGDEPVGIIYLTDGYCSRFPRKAPDCPVLWVILDGYQEFFNPPFGEVVYRHC